ncbi:MAG: 4Fe-4S binding protein [Peptococcaceae bacterium]|nr:4Fe-4S binding protein [Candidatus Syntrophopropionicum ammoniitolerans]
MVPELRGRTLELEKAFWTLFPAFCKGCGLCVEKCPVDCIDWSDILGVYGTPSVEADDRCIACGICENVCPDCAIRIDTRKNSKN